MRSLLAVALVLLPSVASAHIQLVFPPPRTLNQKTQVCGDNSPRGAASVFAPGATITVMWKETINHPGHFRVAFDDDGQDFPIPSSATPGATAGMPTVLIDPVEDTGGSMFSAEITFPSIECTNCTLQVTQLMTDKPPYTDDAASNDIYYQCADITLSATAPDAGAQPGNDAGPTGNDAGADPGGSDGGGCSTGGPTSLGIALSFVGLLRRRRRR